MKQTISTLEDTVVKLRQSQREAERQLWSSDLLIESKETIQAERDKEVEKHDRMKQAQREKEWASERGKEPAAYCDYGTTVSEAHRGAQRRTEALLASPYLSYDDVFPPHLQLQLAWMALISRRGLETVPTPNSHELIILKNLL